MGKNQGTAPKNADQLQEKQTKEETQPVTNDQVIVIGTGTGLLELGREYTCPKETADFHVARGYATLKTI